MVIGILRSLEKNRKEFEKALDPRIKPYEDHLHIEDIILERFFVEGNTNCYPIRGNVLSSEKINGLCKVKYVYENPKWKEWKYIEYLEVIKFDKEFEKEGEDKPITEPYCGAIRIHHNDKFIWRMSHNGMVMNMHIIDPNETKEFLKTEVLLKSTIGDPFISRSFVKGEWRYKIDISSGYTIGDFFFTRDLFKTIETEDGTLKEVQAYTGTHYGGKRIIVF